MYIDSHVHSNISFDGKASVDELAIEGKRLGLCGIALTEHYDVYDGMNPHDDNARPFDLCEYEEKLWDSIEKHKGYIRAGVEIGLRPDTEKTVKIAACLFDYDFVIGSSHIVCGVNVSHDDSFCKPLTKEEAYTRYLDEVCENIKLYGKYFDVYGHLDYIARYGCYDDNTLHYSEFSDAVDKVLKLLVENEVGLEINTAGFRQGLGSPHPTFEVIKRFKELGGEIITLGSDAHIPSALGYRFDDAVKLIKEAGFDSICSFKKREPVFQKI